MPRSLLVTDLDNTLYDWVGFFAPAFEAMVTSLCSRFGFDRETVLSEFKEIHRSHGSSEYPFAILELPSVLKAFPGRSRHELLHELREPLAEFSEERRKRLRLYPGVERTLALLHGAGVRLLAHTEAVAVNALHRLSKLGIAQYFDHLYTLEGHFGPHPDPSWRPSFVPRPDFVREVPLVDRKPNPDLLTRICADEGIPISSAWYVGDSIARDIAMAKNAGVRSVWAKYGASPDPKHWAGLVRITHWTEADVEREARLKEAAKSVQPDCTIESFEELGDLLLGTRRAIASA